MQVILSGEAQCFRQIVTVSNSEGRVISCDKPRVPMVLSVYYLYPDVDASCKLFSLARSHFTLMSVSILWVQIRSSDTSTAESGSEVEEMASPKVIKSYVQPKLTPVCEEVSVPDVRVKHTDWFVLWIYH